MSEAVKPAGSFIFGPPPRGDNAGKQAHAPSIFDGLLDRPASKPGGEIPSPPARGKLDWSWGGLRGSGQEGSTAEPEAGTAGLVDETGRGEEISEPAPPGELPEIVPEAPDDEALPDMDMIAAEGLDEGDEPSPGAVQGGGGTRETTDEPAARLKPQPAALDVPRADAAIGNGKPGEALAGRERPAGVPVLPDTAAKQAHEAVSRAGRGAGAANGSLPALARSAGVAEGKPEPARLPDVAASREAGRGGRQAQGGRNDRFETSWQATFNRNDAGGRGRPLAGPVTLMSSQTMQPTPPIPAVAQLPLGGTAAQIMSAIRDDSDPTWRTATAANQAQEALAARPRPLHSIQIQLNPAELGRVTARLSIAGAQLRVELLVETSQARTQLSNDSVAILKALKSSGYEIDRVTIQQAPQNTNAGTPSGMERGTGNFSNTGGQAGETSEDRRWRGAEGDDGQRERGGDETIQQENAGGGIYI